MIIDRTGARPRFRPLTREISRRGYILQSIIVRLVNRRAGASRRLAAFLASHSGLRVR
jgi:hypothetical protein